MKLALKLAYCAAAGAIVIAVASCATEPPPPLPVAVVPPAAPPPPPVALSPSVLQAASGYRSYIDRAASISPGFTDGGSVQQSLVVAASYEPKQLLRGAIAYAAVVGLQSPQFVAGVRTYAVDPTGRRELAAKLIADPHYAAALPSAASAAGLIAATLDADAAKLRRTGDQVKQAAYDVQRQPWSKGDVPDRDARLALAKQVSAAPAAPAANDVQMMRAAVNGRESASVSMLGVSGEALSAPYAPVVSRGLALAALAALGEANDDLALQRVMEESSSAFCLNMSKLNLYQCLSVAKPYYEDVFCLGQHILLDTAQCMQKAAGVTPVATVAFVGPSATARPMVAPARKPAPKAPAKARAR